jgi:hypothetical protein
MNVRAALAAVFLVSTFFIIAAIMLDLVNTGFFVGPYRFSHWMTWIGTIFIAIYAPLYHFLKRRYPQRVTLLMDVHTFGFLTAFLLISIHFASQMSRPPQAFPELGEGIALYVTMLLLVTTGMIQRFWRPEKKPYRRYTPRSNRFLHISLLSAFYIVIVVHVVTNLLF